MILKIKANYVNNQENELLFYTMYRYGILTTEVESAANTII